MAGGSTSAYPGRGAEGAIRRRWSRPTMPQGDAVRLIADTHRDPAQSIAHTGVESYETGMQ